MSTERFGSPQTEFWSLVEGMNTDWDEDKTVEALSADHGVLCVLYWSVSEGVDEAAAQESKAFLTDRMCQLYGLEPVQCETALARIEQNIREERAHGET